MSSFSTTTVRQVWHDSTGARVEVGADGDGLDLVEIRQFDDPREKVEPSGRIVMDFEMAVLLHRELGAYLDEHAPDEE